LSLVHAPKSGRERAFRITRGDADRLLLDPFAYYRAYRVHAVFVVGLFDIIVFSRGCSLYDPYPSQEMDREEFGYIKTDSISANASA
jgi:hypothetical protein